MSQIAQMPAPNIPDLPAGPSQDHVRGPIAIPPLDTWQIAVIAVIGAIAITLLLWLIIRIVRSPQKQLLQTPPLEAAINALESAANEPTADAFAIKASQALRRYFEDTLKRPTRSESTAEFVHNINLPAKQRSQLENFLNTCDQVKFAKQELTNESRIQLLDTARKLINDTRINRKEEAT
jgi:hypothetical protein